MSSVCDKCKWLWQRLGKNYCKLNRCKYSNNKRKCQFYEEGSNIKVYLGKSNGWWKESK